MRILLTTASSSKQKYKKIYEERKIPMIDPSQKFFQMLVDGITAKNNANVICLTELPISRKVHDRKIWKMEVEYKNEHLVYIYLGFYNKRIIKQLSLIWTTYKQTRKWLKEFKNDSNKYIVCDPLYFSSAFGSKIASIGKKHKRIAVVTDLPRMLKKSTKSSNRGFFREKLQRIYNYFCEIDLKSYDGYIFLTKQMNERVNNSRKPFIVIEGSTEKLKLNNARLNTNKNEKRIILYAGGIAKKNGLDKLVKAFHISEIRNSELHVYGTGPYVEELKNISKSDCRIKYMGVLHSDEIVIKEKEATLLVNPRPTNEEFTKYSFPSKTLEYMSSGTPVLTTKLAGIPDEYNEYLYYFQDESVEGMKRDLEKIMRLTDRELIEKGEIAQDFVNKNKSNIVQGEKITNFLKQI